MHNARGFVHAVECIRSIATPDQISVALVFKYRYVIFSCQVEQLLSAFAA